MSETIHVHPPLGEEVRAIGGHYALTEEKELTVDGRVVLYALGVAEVDSSCCGVAGGAYAIVAGYLLERRFAIDNHGNPLSRVERIHDDRDQHRIRTLVESAESLNQVNFR